MKLSISLALLVVGALQASAANISFTGALAQDDSVQLFTFTVAASSSVTVRTYSYAGGANSAGAVIREGGFDPYVALFSNSGVLIADNDDAPGVSTSPVTLSAYDALLTQTLGSGTYTVALTQFDNFAIGPNLSDGFIEVGSPRFSGVFGCSNGSFCDIDGNNRTSAWAIDFLNVATAAPGGLPNPVPEPSSYALALTGLIAVSGVFLRRRLSQRP